MTREPEIEKLLNAARDAAVNACHGMKADKQGLAELAHVALVTVYAQAEAGMWGEWAIGSAADLRGLKCVAEVHPTLAIREPILIRWDFSRTTLRHLQTA